MRFVLVTFAFLAFAFYELSGGADFEPRKQRPQVASTESAPKPGDAQLTAGTVRVIPDPQKVAAVIDPAQATSLQLTQISAKPAAAATADTPAPTLALRLSQPADAGETLQLASLADEDGSFPQLTFLDPAAPAKAQDPIAEPAPALDIRAVTGSRVNLRQGPGTTYGVIGTLFYDDQVEVLETLDNGWVRLRNVKDNRIGWMTGRFVGKPAE